MKGNLLTLQQIAKMQELTQNRLSTGLKVNSAIDNSDSFYTAASLNNRAGDLSALLDAMSQGIQTLKTAQTGLTMASKFLEQAKSLANKALEFLPTELSKDWYISEAAKQGGVVVSNIAELRKAVADNKELIVVYGKIEINDNVSISPKANQKLVGTEYFSNINKNALYRTSGGNRLSELKFDFNAKDVHGVILDNQALLQDLTINYNNAYYDTVTGNIQGNQSAVYLHGSNLVMSKSATIKNVDISYITGGEKDGEYSRGAIFITNYADLSIEGAVNIKTEGIRAAGILNHDNSQLTISESANINIQTKGMRAYGIVSNVLSTLTLAGTANIETLGSDAHGIYNVLSSALNLSGAANIQALGVNTFGIFNLNKGISNIHGLLNVKSYSYALYNGNSAANNYADNSFNIYGTSKIYLESIIANPILNGRNGYTGADKKTDNVINIFSGAQIAMKFGNNISWRYANKNGTETNNSTTRDDIYTYNTAFPKNGGENILVPATPWKTPTWNAVSDKFNTTLDVKHTQKKLDENYTAQFNGIVSQYDALIRASSYKGINLLDGNDLLINFNEDSSSNINIKGEDASASALGLILKTWESNLDVEKNIKELESAITKIRSMSHEFGNYYNIVSTREAFNNNMINVLQEGADKLTLADMNEESANMLALQTRQQLAINSLSLAAQAVQSILKLF